MRKRSTGFTIVEVLIFSSVSLLLMALLAQLFITATRRTEDSRLKVDLQQKALLVLKKFGQDINLASIRGITAAESGTNYVLALTPVKQRDPEKKWQLKQVLYVYKGDKKELYWREALGSDFNPPLFESKPYLPSSSELVNLSTNSSGKSRILSSHIEEFSLEDGSGSKTQFQTRLLKLNLKLRRPLSHSDRFAEFTVHRHFNLRNNY